MFLTVFALICCIISDLLFLWLRNNSLHFHRHTLTCDISLAHWPGHITHWPDIVGTVTIFSRPCNRVFPHKYNNLEQWGHSISIHTHLLKFAMYEYCYDANTRSFLLQCFSEFCSFVPSILSQTAVPASQFVSICRDLLTSSENAQLWAVITQIIHQWKSITQQLRNCLSTETQQHSHTTVITISTVFTNALVNVTLSRKRCRKILHTEVNMKSHRIGKWMITNLSFTVVNKESSAGLVRVRQSEGPP